MKKCQKHPKYKGKKKPKIECFQCLELYLSLKNKPRILPKPSKRHKSKKDYDRKKAKKVDY